jgi:hypothetical protein
MDDRPTHESTENIRTRAITHLHSLGFLNPPPSIDILLYLTDIMKYLGTTEANMRLLVVFRHQARFCNLFALSNSSLKRCSNQASPFHVNEYFQP